MTHPNVKRVPTSELNRELRRRMRILEAKRARVAREIEQLDTEIETLGGHVRPASGKGRLSRRGAWSYAGQTRAMNKVSLVKALHQLLQGKKMGVTEAARAVQEAGYKTHAANFRAIVNTALARHPKVFTRTAPGVYTAK